MALNHQQFTDIAARLREGEHFDNVGLENYGGMLHVHGKPYPFARQIPNEVVHGESGRNGYGPGEQGRTEHAFEVRSESGRRLHLGWREGDPRMTVAHLSPHATGSADPQHPGFDRPYRSYSSMTHTADDVPAEIESVRSMDASQERRGRLAHFWWD